MSSFDGCTFSKNNKGYHRVKLSCC